MWGGALTWAYYDCSRLTALSDDCRSTDDIGGGGLLVNRDTERLIMAVYDSAADVHSFTCECRGRNNSTRHAACRSEVKDGEPSTSSSSRERVFAGRSGLIRDSVPENIVNVDVIPSVSLNIVTVDWILFGHMQRSGTLRQSQQPAQHSGSPSAGGWDQPGGPNRSTARLEDWGPHQDRRGTAIIRGENWVDTFIVHVGYWSSSWLIYLTWV